MPIKAFCDNCKRELLFNEPQPYGIVFLLPGEGMRPKQTEKMLCKECFVDFYIKAGFKWSDIKLDNEKSYN